MGKGAGPGRAVVVGPLVGYYIALSEGMGETPAESPKGNGWARGVSLKTDGVDSPPPP